MNSDDSFWFLWLLWRGTSISRINLHESTGFRKSSSVASRSQEVQVVRFWVKNHIENGPLSSMIYIYIYGPHLYCRHLVNRDGVFHSKSLISIPPCENLIDKLLTCFCFLWSPLSKTNGPSPSGRGTKFDRAVILNDVGGRRMSNPLESACGLALFCPWFPSHGSMDQDLADAQELWPSDLAMLICWEPTAGSWCYVSPSCNPPAHGTKSRCAGSRWKWAEKKPPQYWIFNPSSCDVYSFWSFCEPFETNLRKNHAFPRRFPNTPHLLRSPKSHVFPWSWRWAS